MFVDACTGPCADPWAGDVCPQATKPNAGKNMTVNTNSERNGFTLNLLAQRPRDAAKFFQNEQIEALYRQQTTPEPRDCKRKFWRKNALNSSNTQKLG
jgi:hypothetical protein